jgi:uncharacterized Zn-binding protein involved in type VI secretion
MSQPAKSARGELGGLELAGVGHRVTHEDDLPEARQIAVFAARLAASELCRRNDQGPVVSMLAGRVVGEAAERVWESTADDEQHECPDPCGAVEVGSPHTLVGPEGRAVALVDFGDVPCERHADEPIRQGSPDVLVDGKPVARRTDETECGAYVGEGEPTVLVGAQTATYAPVRGEQPDPLSVVLAGSPPSGELGRGPGAALAVGAALAHGASAGGASASFSSATGQTAALEPATGSAVGQKLLVGDVQGAVAIAQATI